MKYSRYCSDPETVILCVIPANVDLSTSESLKIARDLDPEGERTIGVLTKIDIMDLGTNCKSVLMNNEIKLKLGKIKQIFFFNLIKRLYWGQTEKST